MEHEVLSVRDDEGLTVAASASGSIVRQRFDHVVNALWHAGSRSTRRSGCGRCVRGCTSQIRDQLPASGGCQLAAECDVSGSGPFGEVVSYGDGLTYLTWYPVCLQAIS